MNFIENLFNLAPDGGSGMTEAAIFIAVLLAATLWLNFRLLLRGRYSRNQPRK